MASEPLPRGEFEGYVRRHEADQFAHAAMRHDLRNEILGDSMKIGGRLDALERWQQRIIGAGSLLALVVAGGGIGIVIELLRK